MKTLIIPGYEEEKFLPVIVISSLKVVFSGETLLIIGGRSSNFKSVVSFFS